MAAPMESKQGLVSPKNSTIQIDNQQTASGDETNKNNALLFAATGLSVFIGFGYTLFKARRRDPLYFKKMLKGDVELPENGIALATKALIWGSVLSVTSFGVLLFGSSKLLGVKDFQEFHVKMKTYFPNKPTGGRSDFKNLTELAEYLVSEDRKAEVAKRKGVNDS